MLRFIHPSVRLSLLFSDTSGSLDGDMRASPFQTRSKRGSTEGYARILIYKLGHIVSPHDILFLVPLSWD